MKTILVWGNVGGDVTLYADGKKVFRGFKADADEYIALRFSGMKLSYGATKGAAVPAAPAPVETKAPKAKRARKAKGALLSPASEELFRQLVADAGNWSGTPLYQGDKATNGNLSDLKRKELITTTQDEDNRACVWVTFTPAGKELALKMDPTNAPYIA